MGDTVEASGGMNGDTKKLEDLERQLKRLKERLDLADRLPQTTLGFQLSTEVHSLGHVPTARVYNSAAIDIVTATPTALTFNSEWWDNDDIHSTATNTDRLTAPVTGIYLVIVSIEWEADADGYRLLYLQKNGSIALNATKILTTAAPDYQSVSTIVDLDFSEYVRAIVEHSAGNNLEVTRTEATSPEFSIVKVAEIGQL